MTVRPAACIAQASTAPGSARGPDTQCHQKFGVLQLISNASPVFTATRLHIVAQGWTRSGLPWVTPPVISLTLKALYKALRMICSALLASQTCQSRHNGLTDAN
jgi:hypothetical protein